MSEQGFSGQKPGDQRHAASPDRGRELTKETALLFQRNALALGAVLGKRKKGARLPSAILEDGTKIFVHEYKGMHEVVEDGGTPDELYMEIAVVVIPEQSRGAAPRQIEYGYLANGQVSKEVTILDATGKKDAQAMKESIIKAIQAMNLQEGIDTEKMRSIVEKKKKSFRELWDAGLIIADESDVAEVNERLEAALQELQDPAKDPEKILPCEKTKGEFKRLVQTLGEQGVDSRGTRQSFYRIEGNRLLMISFPHGLDPKIVATFGQEDAERMARIIPRSQAKAKILHRGKGFLKTENYELSATGTMKYFVFLQRDDEKSPSEMSEMEARLLEKKILDDIQAKKDIGIDEEAAVEGDIREINDILARVAVLQDLYRISKDDFEDALE